MSDFEKSYRMWEDARIREEETLRMAEWMIDHKSTVRDLEKEFLVPKTTVHYRLTNLLMRIDYDKWKQCMNILEEHKRNRVQLLNRGRKPRK